MMWWEETETNDLWQEEKQWNVYVTWQWPVLVIPIDSKWEIIIVLCVLLTVFDMPTL